MELSRQAVGWMDVISTSLEVVTARWIVSSSLLSVARLFNAKKGKEGFSRGLEDCEWDIITAGFLTEITGMDGGGCRGPWGGSRGNTYGKIFFEVGGMTLVISWRTIAAFWLLQTPWFWGTRLGGHYWWELNGSLVGQWVRSGAGGSTVYRRGSFSRGVAVSCCGKRPRRDGIWASMNLDLYTLLLGAILLAICPLLFLWRDLDWLSSTSRGQ